MFKRKPILKYESTLKEYPDTIVPSKSVIPEWYRKIPKWANNEIFTMDEGVNQTVKQCMPFLDALSCGYVATLPYDLVVKVKEDGSPYIVWNDELTNTPNTPGWRPKIAHENIVPKGYYPTEYTWNSCVSFEVPSGYNMLITHPLNRHDLPFLTLTGIIEGNFTVQPHGSLPFYIREGFEGLIRQGTPIFQIIPFRVESWHSKKESGLAEQGLINQKASALVFNGWYKNKFWTRKEYK